MGLRQLPFSGSQFPCLKNEVVSEVFWNTPQFWASVILLSFSHEPGTLWLEVLWIRGSFHQDHWPHWAAYCLLFCILQKAMVAHSGALAWKIPWMEKPGGLQSMGSQRVGHDWATLLFHFHFHLSMLNDQTIIVRSCCPVFLCFCIFSLLWLNWFFS